MPRIHACLWGLSYSSSLLLSRGAKLTGRKGEAQFSFHISDSSANTRLDVYLADNLTGFSRSQIQKYLHENTGSVILVNSGTKKPHYHLKPGDTVEVNIPEPEAVSLEPVSINLDILYEDQDIIVLNKQPGIPVHPSCGHENDTVVNALLFHLGQKGLLSNIGGEKRPGIVHRLDKDTAGVMVIAKNNLSHTYISRQFARREIEKTYEAIVKGTVIPASGIIDKPIIRSTKNRKKFTVGPAGRESLTRYKVIDSRNETSWVEFRPKTGRTHQLRVHAVSIGHPIIGDPLYARRSYPVQYIALFARSILFKHPKTGLEIKFSAPYPVHFVELANTLGYTIK